MELGRDVSVRRNDDHGLEHRGGDSEGSRAQRLAAQRGRTGSDHDDGHIVVEVNTRRAMSGAEREADLAEALAFARLHLAAPAEIPGR